MDAGSSIGTVPDRSRNEHNAAASVCRWRFGRLCLTPVKVSGHIYFVRKNFERRQD